MFVMDYYGHKLSNGVLFAHHLILDVPGGSSHLGYRRRVPPGHNPHTRVKKHPPLCEAQRVQKSVNPETKKVVRLQNCSRAPDHFSESNFKFQMFSNDILNCKNIKKAVTEKTVKILNLNFKFL